MFKSWLFYCPCLAREGKGLVTPRATGMVDGVLIGLTTSILEGFSADNLDLLIDLLFCLFADLLTDRSLGDLLLDLSLSLEIFSLSMFIRFLKEGPLCIPIYYTDSIIIQHIINHQNSRDSCYSSKSS